ncbi:MAG: methyltransferase domain-containing protein [Betaproteobacteria bacterium]|nr:methyltransferase domain-containing protein [Betaproteobacteria bacterium]
MKIKQWLFLVALGGAAVGMNPALAQMHMPDHYDRQFDKAKEWAKTFDDPARDHWQQPERVIAALAIAPNATVADIGSGTGYFAVRLAQSVPQGRVLGIDIQPDMVHYLNERAHREGLTNLVSRLGAKDDPKLPSPVDLAIVVDTYHHIGGRDQYFRRVRDKLKPGRLVIIDFRQDAVLGPPKHFRVSPEQVKQELSKIGFEFVKEETFLPQQYFLVFQAAS